MIIYLFENMITGGTYVGKSVNTLEKRWRGHLYDVRYGSQTHFHRAIRKYGAEWFFGVVLEENPDCINQAEKHWISRLNPSYNMTEGGDGGWINDQTGNTWKVKDSSRMGKYFASGRVHKSEAWINSTTGGNNYQCHYVITTPWGEFETWRDATNAAKELRRQGRKDVVTDGATLKKYCTENTLLNKEGRRTFPDWRGKYTHDIGFGYASKR